MNPSTVQKYTVKPQPEIEAVMFDGQNGKLIANWCGGTLTDIQTHDSGVVIKVRVPHVNGGFDLDVGEYLVRDLSTGRFHKVGQHVFEDTYVQKPPVYTPRESWEGFPKPLGGTMNTAPAGSRKERNGVGWNLGSHDVLDMS
jgi:hypothetical protein